MENDHDFVFGDVTYEILSAAFEVHNTLGSGFLEKVYENALCVELQKKKLKVETQKEINVNYKGTLVGSYYADMLIEEDIVVELKAVDVMTRAHEAQLLNYLKATEKKLGLLINFGKGRVEYKRFVL